jgi:hypothetical protein
MMSAFEEYAKEHNIPDDPFGIAEVAFNAGMSRANADLVAALQTVKNFIDGEPIAHAVMSDEKTTLMQVVDNAILKSRDAL